MPPRKSNASTAAAAEAPSKASNEDGLSVEDLNLPRSIIGRLAKGVLPANTQIQKDALTAMSKSATVFVNYITNQANEHAQRSGKKTIQPKDVFEAIKELEFEGFSERLEAEVNKFQSIQSEKRSTYRKKVRDEKAAKESGTTRAGTTDESPPTKRARRSTNGHGVEASASDEEEEVEEVVEDENQEDEEEEDEEEEEGEGDEEVGEEPLTEDPLEVRDSEGSDDEIADGDDSD